MKLWQKRVITVVAFAVPILVTYHISYVQGAFERGELTLSIGKDAIRPSDDTHVFVAIDPTTDLDDIVYFPANLEIRNDGDKLINNARLSLAYDKRSHYTAINPNDFMEFHGAQFPEDSAHDFNSTDDADFSNFGLKSLNVKSHFLFKDGVQFYKEVSPSSFFDMGLLRSEVKASLQADNIERTEYEISFRGVRAKNCDELVLRYKTEYAKYLTIQKRDDSSLLAYFWHLLIGPDQRNDYLICPVYQSLAVNGKRIWIPTGGSKDVFQVRFRPYVWSLLFDMDKPSDADSKENGGRL